MSASETPFVAAADVMNPARKLCAAKSPSMPAASLKRFTSRATSIDAMRLVELLAAVECAKDRAVRDIRDVEPFADVGRGAQATIGNERDRNLAALAFLVGFAPAQRHDQ